MSSLVLRLPPSLLAEGFNLARLIARDPARSWSEGYRLLERFELSSRERRFARALLERRPNLWLYRCDQRSFCGDFVVIDMSAPRPADRRVTAVELKAGVAPRPGGGGQFERLDGALAALVAAGVITPESEVARIIGDFEAVLALL